MPAEPLPERLRLATRDWHARAERSGVMADMLAGRLARRSYILLQRNLHALYSALETALQALHDDAAVALLAAAAPRRAPALAADLVVLHGAGWQDELPLQPAAADYTSRLEALAQSRSRALAAHAYVRYLGDLYGGQIVRRRVVGLLGLTGEVGEPGLSFYDFGSQEQVLAHRQALRSALAELPLSEPECQRVLAEACWGFEQHCRLFEQLQQAA